MVKTCPQSGICYSVNVPSTSASSGNGDLYFQIQAPSSLQWVGLGQGQQMAGANIFIIYANQDGNNVTLSPRLGAGNYQPSYDQNSAQASLLDGTGIANGVMTANVRCTYNFILISSCHYSCPLSLTVPIRCQLCFVEWWFHEFY